MSVCAGIATMAGADVAGVGRVVGQHPLAADDVLAAVGAWRRRWPPCIRSNAAASISGPTSVPSRAGRRSARWRTALARRSTSSSRIDVCTIRRRRLRAALAGGADGREDDAAHGELEVGRRGDDRRVVAAELEDRAAEAATATTGATARPMRVEPVADTIGDALVGGERRADVGAAEQHLVEAGRRADVGGGPLQQRVARQRGQRRLVRRLPDHRVAARRGRAPRSTTTPRPGS